MQVKQQIYDTEISGRECKIMKRDKDLGCGHISGVFSMNMPVCVYWDSEALTARGYREKYDESSY